MLQPALLKVKVKSHMTNWWIHSRCLMFVGF